ncbi:MAG TPA: hypothetical protein VNF75_07200 [Candidatus Dormibacteraeota bacterium]|nr:hypothetical protein [Candidatus Dormibacteraeota bacterium]
MILDRDLTPALLDVALRVASAPTPWAAQRRLLTVALRDHVSIQEAEGKTKKCLTRVWVNPPPAAAEMIAWGREHQQLAADRRLLHLGALLAAFPFAGGVAALVGRALTLDGYAAPEDIRQRARGLWGDRPAIDIGARKAYTTLVRLGVLAGGHGAPLVRGEALETDAEMSGWLIHAYLLTRGIQSVNEADLSAAPELFWVKLSRPSGTYPLVTRQTEGGRRVVWAATP